MRLLGRIGIALGLVLGVAALVVHGLGAGWFGRGESAGDATLAARPAEHVAARQALQRRSALEAGVEQPKQILFGDLHVHTTFSFDAFLLNLPMLGGPGSRPPSDACDFARYCSELDFWSINDHAENLSQRLWQETIRSVRQCNEVAGDPADPDLVTYLGWEWSQIGRTPQTHYGHKNVVLLGTADEEIPTRPIAARSRDFLPRDGRPFPRGFPTLVALNNGQRGRDFAFLLNEMGAAESCSEDVGVRDLPGDCREATDTPEQLFDKLRDWALPSLVIPHGTAWGLYTPAGSSWDKQLPGHDAGLQRLVEVYSGHGNSEEYRDFRAVELAPDGSKRCPEPSQGYTPSCWQAGVLIRARCAELGESAAECERRAVEARQHYVDANNAGWVPMKGHRAPAWRGSGQCSDCFQPAFNYRPMGSAQYMMALRSFEDPQRPKGYEFGFIGSSDNHSAAPGTGYKELGRGLMSEGRGRSADTSAPGFLVPEPGDPVAKTEPFDPETGPRALGLFETERASSFFVTGGLVAVHAAGRDRQSIWDAMQAKEVYATSGPRILLWFDLIDLDGRARPMGSTLDSSTPPRFRARALGSFVQKPGCPEHSIATLSQERLEELCLGECYHPSDERRRITRIEVVRVRPQSFEGEPIEGLIEDPWRSFDCPGDGAGCSIEFDDPDFVGAARDAVYYVRAIEQESQAIHGSNPLGCRYDQQGQCVSVAPCNQRSPAEDDCLSPTEQRAWSSPIFVHHDDAPQGSQL